MCKVEKFVCWVSETNDTHSRSTPRLTQGEVKGIRSIAQATEPFKAISIRMNARGHRDEIERSPDDSQSLRESESLYQKHSEFTDCRFRGHSYYRHHRASSSRPSFAFVLSLLGPCINRKHMSQHRFPNTFTSCTSKAQHLVLRPVWQTRK